MTPASHCTPTAGTVITTGRSPPEMAVQATGSPLALAVAFAINTAFIFIRQSLRD